MRLIIALLALCAPALSAQGKTTTEPEKKVGDTRVVDFFLPNQFGKAKTASKERNRCLLIKGVAFGVDKVGAGCATKGHW